MKKLAKQIVASILGWQVRRLRGRHDFKIIAVGGSVGKTSTKLAISAILSQKFAVRHQGGNYNDLVSVPLIFFGHKLPNIFNPFAWLRIIWKNETIIRRKYPFEIVVVELGTDAPGQIERFEGYLHADIGVITGIAPEHMEFFGDMEAIAKEELHLAELSNELVVNKDLVPEAYLGRIKQPSISYGVKKPATYRLTNIRFSGNFADFDVLKSQKQLLKARHDTLSEPQLLSVCAAIAVADQLGMNPEEIERGIDTIKPISGRMQRLDGINGSTIIDDTYNASPEAVQAALDTLYRIDAPQKIAVLGNMNELGSYSQAMHEEVGKYCKPEEINLLVTIGPDANKYLAPAAEAAGCTVQTFDSPVEAGEAIKQQVEKGALILVKGSQNRVIAEETVKRLLANPADSRKLVRQSKDWLKIKRKAFGP